MKKVLFVLLGIISLQALAQDSEVIKLKKTYTKISSLDSITLKHPEKKIIALNTFIVTIDSSQLNFLKDFSLLDNVKLVKKYKFHAFGYDKKRTLGQIKGPIVIYMDKLFSKDIKSKFITFIEDIPEIKNLNFSFTNDIEKANYFIDVLDSDVDFFTEKQKSEISDEDFKNDTFSEMTYKFYANNDSKFISCHFQINKSILKDELFLTKLKKGFFRSLGSFFESKHAPKASLLYKKPILENEYLSDYDIIMLKFHYNHLYSFRVNSEVFDSLINMRKKLAN